MKDVFQEGQTRLFGNEVPASGEESAGGMPNLIEQGRTALGLGDEPPTANKRVRRGLHQLARNDPDHFGVVDLTQEVGTGLFNGLLRRKVRVTEPRAQVLDNTTSPLPEGQRPIGKGRILRPDQTIGKLIKNLAGDGADAQLERTEQYDAPEQTAIREILAKKYQNRRQRLVAAQRIVEAREVDTDITLELAEKKRRGQALREQFSKHPVVRKTSLLGALIGGGGWSNSMKIGQDTTVWHNPTGKVNDLPVKHEDMGRSFFITANPPDWIDTPVKWLRRLTGRDIQAPFGRVDLRASGVRDQIASVVVKKPTSFAAALTETYRQLNNSNLEVPPIKQTLAVSDILTL